MTTARSILTPECDSQNGSCGEWPVLARIPDVATTSRPAPQRPPRPAAAADRAADYRFDPPQPRGSHAAAANAAPDNHPTESGDHAAHALRPPAHHLYQRSSRTVALPSDRAAQADSPILPTWDPFTIPGSRFPDSFAPILSFLLLVALFTAAGTSVLMLRNSDRQSISGEDRPSKPGIQQSAAGPTAVGPRGLPAARLEVDSTITREPTASTASALSPPATTSTDVNATSSDITNVDTTPPVSDTPEPQDYPQSEYPETSQRPAPPVQASDTPSAAAHLPGYILPTAPRQAQHDDQSSVY